MTYNPDNPNEHEYDPYDDAMSDEPSMFFGKVEIEAYPIVVADDGTGWKPQGQYVAELHGTRAEINKADDKFIATDVDISITPADPSRKMIQRTNIPTKSKKRTEFQRVIRPSIEALEGEIAKAKGLQVGQFNPLKELGGLWVAGEFVPKPSNKPDETWTTLKFTRVFAGQDECIEAMNAHYNHEGAAEAEGDNGHDEERAKLAPFLQPIWAQAEGDKDKMAELLATNSMLCDHFTVDSPEVQALMAEGEE